MFLLPALAYGQSPTGIISGTITHADTQRPLQDVNVQLYNTTLGGATSENGQFKIANVPGWHLHTDHLFHRIHPDPGGGYRGAQ